MKEGKKQLLCKTNYFRKIGGLSFINVQIQVLAAINPPLWHIATRAIRQNIQTEMLHTESDTIQKCLEQYIKILSGNKDDLQLE